jgi:hypothetical protein
LDDKIVTLKVNPKDVNVVKLLMKAKSVEIKASKEKLSILYAHHVKTKEFVSTYEEEMLMV